MSAPSRPGAPRSSARSASRASGTSARKRTGPATGGSRTARTRPSGPSGPGRVPPASKPHIDPAKRRGSFAAMLSWRTGVLVLVIILSLAVILPSLRVYFNQQQELADLRAEVEEARADVNHLEAEVARWDDPSFIVAQARERLAYVFPGETPYRVIDPEFVTTHAEGSPAAERATEAVGDGIWFELLWDSVMVAGNGEPEISDEPTTFAGQDDVEDTLTDVDFGG